MALTVNISRTDTVGRYTKYVTGTIQFDSSYATGGESLTGSDLTMPGKVEFVDIVPTGEDDAFMYEYDYTNSKVLVLYPTSNETPPGPALQVSGSTNLNGVIARFIAFGH